jgi:hypothetical protein
MADVNVFYRAKRAIDLANPVVETMFTRADPTALGQPVFTIIPASGKTANQKFKVTVVGDVTSGAALNITLALRVGVSTAGVLLATTGAIALAAAGTFQYELTFEGVWDSDSQTLRGRMSGFVGATLVAAAINSTLITGFDPNGQVDMQVIATALFGTSNAANVARLKELVTGLS